MTPEPFISYADALLFLNKEPDTTTALEEQQINLLIAASTSVIIAYCGVDPRTDPDQDCAVLEIVAARLIMRWFPALADQSAGTTEESFDSVTVKYDANSDIDPLSKIMLNRFRYVAIV